MPAERLQKILARAGVASRRAAEGLIADGRVTVNGRVATVGESADPARDRVAVDGTPVAEPAEAAHLVVHKPAGFVSSARDERGRASVLRLVRGFRGAEQLRLWPAGRLDAASEGLLVLTNDGEWANLVLHPRYGLEREYAVLVDPPPPAELLDRLVSGVELEDGFARLLAAARREPPDEVAREAQEQGAWLRVTVGEGRKREVRRLFAAAGLRVQRLVRTALGPLRLDGLASGAWRVLDEQEVTAMAAGGPRRPAAGRRPAPITAPTTAPITVAIDGPSGSGKSTVGWAVAQRLGATFVDTGLLYRALTLAALERDIDADDADGLGRLAQAVRIDVRRPRPDQVDRRETVLLDGRDVTHQAREPRIDRAVSSVSRHPGVRDAMLEVQRHAARGDDTVMVGRDIGTVVLPDATLKVFLTATISVRAARRAAEMGRPDRLDDYLGEIERRDAADSGRSVAPLRVAPGALVLNTGELDVDACADAIVAHLPVRPSHD
jgi:cytidylate kinase